MSTLPIAGYFAASPRPAWPAAKAALDDMRDVIVEQPGGAASQALTISSGTITPAEAASRNVIADTEGGAGTDDLANIAQTNCAAGHFLVLRAASAARVITVKNGAGGVGQFVLVGSRDVLLDATTKAILFEMVGTTWKEIARFGFPDDEVVTAHTADFAVSGLVSGLTHTNAGAAGAVVATLPTAVAGLRRRFCVMAAQTFTIQAAAGDKIRNAATLSAAAGTAASATIGCVIELVAVDAEVWLVVSIVGAWTVT